MFMDKDIYFYLTLVISILFIGIGSFFIAYFIFFLRFNPYAPTVTSVILYCVAGYSIYNLVKKSKKKRAGKT